MYNGIQMKILLDLDDEEEKAVNIEMINDLAEDLALNSVIELLYLYVRVKDPVFIVSLYVTSDIADKVKRNIFDLFSRLLPEGFRVRKIIFNKNNKNNFSIIASEDQLKEEWLKKAQEIKF